ncbi:ROK family transcriptional regulator [Enterococcus sp. BWT-B8]|uniref:ROK family transcriptional regulator n=1 Tax=Enterococcus sp. BWT-B8 TaxID=2885157 RepID=UPI001E350340|nr:ROK family transcriptional regulator [Enterococcus sp. BWT-B8]MCB5953338.1 ROK family transcriptional regulator [Enterococcus sp. BWT-B8]
MKAGTPNQLKSSNLHRLRKIIQKEKRITKPELAEKSGLSTMTVNNLMKDLLAENEVIETKASATTGGRKASVFEFNALHQLVLTVALLEKDKAVTFLFTVHDLNGQILRQKVQPGNYFDKTLVKAQIAGFIKDYPTIQCLVIGLPGVEHEGILKDMDFPLLKDENLKEYLEEAFGFDVITENDVNAVIYGYSQVMPLEAENAVVGLYYPESFPPGAGIVLHDRLVKGRNGVAGEIAHLPSDPDWKTFSYSEEEVIGNLLNNVQTFMSLYDPDCFVIYRDKGFTDEHLKERIEQRMKEEFPYAELPEIVLSKDFHNHYIYGLFALGITQLNTQWEQFD